jgi:hypothetical protein
MWRKWQVLPLLILWCLSGISLTEAFCEGTLYYRLHNEAGIRSVSVHAHPFASGEFLTAEGGPLSGTDAADAGIAVDGDYLCFFVVSVPEMRCMTPIATGTPFKYTLPITTGFLTNLRLQVVYAGGHVAFDRILSGVRLAVHTFLDNHDGSVNDAGSYSGADVLTAFSLIPISASTDAYLYHQEGTTLRVDQWPGGTGYEPTGDFAIGTPFGSNPVDTLAYAGDSLYAYGFQVALPYLAQITIGSSPLPTAATKVLPSGFGDFRNLDFASTTRECSSLVMMYNHTDRTELGFYNPETSTYQSILNTTIGTKVASMAWSSIPLIPPPPVTAPVEPPVEPPVEFVAPSITFPSETAGPPVSPATCMPPAPEPENAFSCDPSTHIWTANATSLTASPIVLSNPIVVIGDLDATETITFQGLDSTLNVTGCIDLQGVNVELVLSEEELKELEKLKSKTSLLITANCSATALKDTTFSITAKSAKKCQKVTGETQGTANTLSVILKFNGNKCNTWWIIVASVVGGLLVIAIVTIILLATFNKSVKSKMRPYWSRHKQPESTSPVS